MNKQDFLMHHGVKGMRWGHRKEDWEVTSKTASGVKDAANTSSNAADRISRKSQRNKDASRMTDEQLRQEIARMKLEQEYSSLNPSKTAKGASVAADALSVIGSLAAVGVSVATIATAILDYREKTAPKKKKYSSPVMEVIKN